MKYIVDIKGEIEGDYEIIGKYKPGKWLDDPDGYKCSACGAYFEIECGDGEINFCPNCGADMRDDS